MILGPCRASELHVGHQADLRGPRGGSLEHDTSEEVGVFWGNEGGVMGSEVNEVFWVCGWAFHGGALERDPRGRIPERSTWNPTLLGELSGRVSKMRRLLRVASPKAHLRSMDSEPAGVAGK